MSLTFEWRSLQAAIVLASAGLLAACGGGSAPSGTTTAPASGATTPAVPVGADTPDSTVLVPSTPDTSTGGTVTTPAATVLTLPLEVLGDGSSRQPVIAEAGMGVAADKLSSVAKLWFQCHRCGFYGAPEFEAASSLPVKIKASVRILGGVAAADEASVPWIDVTDATVTLADDARLHGGVNGGLYTTRISITLDAAARARLVALPAYNRIQFRFNGTDGESNGFRVLNVQLQDASATDVGSNTIKRFDPTTERDVSNIAAADVAAGKALWYAHGTIAKSSIVSHKLQAACASCHAENGRDLQYFNYSNNAIVQRSRFHGLSETQGKQIAAFLRSTLQNVAYVEKARPWNPPYQPGPGVDCNTAGCATAWAAGAGLDAILSTPAEQINALFGKSPGAAVSISQADVDKVMDANATLNVREMPVALQFPDWNAWLPTVHPLDLWPSGTDGSGFENGATFSNGTFNPNGRYLQMKAWLASHKNPNGNMADWSHLTPDQRAEIMELFYVSGFEDYNFVGGSRGNHIAGSGQYGGQVAAARMMALISPATTAAGPAVAFTTNAFIERAVTSVFRWNAVKQWEMAQDYSLEGNQQWFIGAKNASTGAWKGRGEAHGWPYNSMSLFYLAPHMMYQEDPGSREWILAWEADNKVASYYRSNQWYQLQMTVNPGAQSDWVNFPMDWPYLTAFDDYLGQLVGEATPAAKAAQNVHYLRILQARIKEAQYANNDITLYDPTEPNLVNNRGRYGRAQILKHIGVYTFLDNAVPEGVGRSKFSVLDDVSPGLYLKVVNGAIQQFNQVYAVTSPAAWRRCDPNTTMLNLEPEPVAGFRYCLDQAKKPLGTFSDGTHYMNWNANYQITTEQNEQYGLWKATQLGAEPARLKVWRDWSNAVWP
jgi:hypothetical protein